MQRLFLISHEHDDDDVVALCAALHNAGLRTVHHTVRDGQVGAIAVPTRTRMIVILWSGALIDHPAVEALAARLRGRARLIEGRLDDAMPSADAAEIVDFRSGFGGDPAHRFAALFAKAAPARGRLRLPAWSFAALGLAALAAVGLAAPHLQRAAPAQAAREAVRQTMAAQPNLAAPEADGAREQADWLRLSQTTGAVERLTAAQGFRALYPDSPLNRDAATIEIRERARIQNVQTELLARGFDPGPANGVAHPQTIAAVRAFQASIQAPLNGQIDDKLLAALAAANGSPRSLALGAMAGAPPQPAGAPTRAAPARVVRDCFLCPEMVILPPMFGAVGDRSGRGLAAEQPGFDAAIAYELAVGRFEVTAEEWDACVDDGACPGADSASGRGQRPVSGVSYSDAKRYTAWLARKTGRGYRLLSETEWEIYARAGAVTSYRGGDRVSQLCASSIAAVVCGRPRQAAAVGAEKPNALGLADMTGNVWEWVEDCWADTLNQMPRNGAPRLNGCSDGLRVIRGGGFDSNADELRLSFRRAVKDERLANVGLRVARPIDQRDR